MKKENKTNRNRQDKKPEERFTLEQVQSLAMLVTSGVLGIGGSECIEDAQKLPESLQKVLIASILAARECMKLQVPSMLASILAKASKP